MRNECLRLITPRVVEKKDNVKNPSHYKFFNGEAIEVIKNELSDEEFVGWCKGNALKYRLRAGKKGDVSEDIAKAMQFEEFYKEFAMAKAVEEYGS